MKKVPNEECASICGLFCGACPHRYFFVEKFYETDFKKITPKSSMGTRIFDLSQVLGLNKIPDTEKIAELLKEKTWN